MPLSPLPCLQAAGLLSALALCVCSSAAGAQQETDEPYSRRNTFSLFGEYSNDSSHIISGRTPNRKFAGLGVQYEGRLFKWPSLSLSYVAEFRPFVVTSDPVAQVVTTVVSTGMQGPFTFSDSEAVFQCVAGTQVHIYKSPTETNTDTSVTTCGREKTLAQGGSPIGFRLRLRPHHPLQFTVTTNGGYLFATKPIPIPQAGSFNFTYSLGVGAEYFVRPRRSLRLEFIVQHYSNHGTADENPGVDHGLFRLSYAFGR